MFGLFKKKKADWSYYWKPDIYEPNVYFIMRKNDWFMKVKVNGELTLIQQEAYIESIVGFLNKNYLGKTI